jgi:DNA-binding response OmpR family regulator
MHVLVVEEEDAIAEPLQEGLRSKGWRVTRASTTESALAELQGAGPHPDVVLIHVRVDDFEACRGCEVIRESGVVRYLIVSAECEEIDRVVALNLRADDYVVKPYGVRELVARVEAATHRSAANHGPHAGLGNHNGGGISGITGGSGRTPIIEPLPELHVGGGQRAAIAGNTASVVTGSERERISWDVVEIDPAAHRTWIGDNQVELTTIEFGILRELVRAQGATVSRPQLLENVWGTRWYGPSKTIDVHVANLRRKLGDPGVVETVRGVGYRLRGSR